MQQEILDIYTDYLISQNKQVTATGLSALLDGEITHDKITRFLNGEQLCSKDLWNYIKRTVRKIEQEQGGVLILDDTIEEKPYTDENEIVCWNYSHAKGSHVKGIDLLSCLVRYGDIAVPIGFDVVSKDLKCYDTKTKKDKRKSSITKNERFRVLIRQAKINNIKFDYVLADSWFGAKENMEFVHYSMKKAFIFGIKSNRLMAFSAEEKMKGQYQNLRSVDFKDGEKKIVWLKDMAFSVALIKKVFINEDGTTGTLFLVTNDLDSDADQIYEVYKKRWRIEEYHKSIKQNTALEKSPTKVVASQKNHIFASLVAYCKLELLKLKTGLNHFAIKYRLMLKANRVLFMQLRNLNSSANFA